MKISQKFFIILLIFLYNSTHPADCCTSVYFDIETIFKADNIRASKYIGKLDALKYWKKTGNMPNQDDLFKSLLAMPSDTDLETYNNNLKMPQILSSWLTNKTHIDKLHYSIRNFLQNSHLSSIEKTVLGNIIDMMITPEKLIDIQKPINETIRLAAELKSKGFNVYLVGNWAHIDSLTTQFSQMLSAFTDIYVSGTMQTLKPYQEFYEHILEKTNTPANQAIWIEKEGEFITKAKSFGYNIATFKDTSPKDLLSELSDFGVNIK